MTTRQELERMVEEKARDGAIEYCLKDEYPTGNSGFIAGFKSGAAFVMDKLMPEIEKLNEENKLIYNLLQIQELSRDLQRICDRTQTPPERGEE